MRQKKGQDWSINYNSINRNGLLRLSNMPKTLVFDGVDMYVTNDTIYFRDISIDEFLVIVNFIRSVEV